MCAGIVSNDQCTSGSNDQSLKPSKGISLFLFFIFTAYLI
jgi:hypothetical protein